MPSSSSASAPIWPSASKAARRWDAHREALTPEQWAEHRADLDARRPFRSLQFEIEAGDGRWLWISISGMPRFDAGGRFVGYHGVGRDITARQQAQALLLRHNEALQRAVDERTRDLQQMNLDLDAFARQLAHELRTPDRPRAGPGADAGRARRAAACWPRTRSCCSCRCMPPSACARRSMRCWRWPARRCSRCRCKRWT